MSVALYCRPSDIMTPSATITVTSGAEDSTYPRTNLNDKKAYTVAKGTGTSITFKATFSGSKTLQAVACINTNATAITLTNAAGLSQSIAIPTTPEDGHPIDPWIDLRLLSNTSSDQWSVALTGPTGVGLGELLLVQTLRTLPIKWGLTEDDEHRTSTQKTDYGTRLIYGMGVRQRHISGELVLLTDADRAALTSLVRDARSQFPFLLVLNSSVNDALYVEIDGDASDIVRAYPTLSTAQIDFVEQQKGLAL
jgi:hypothetical protein